MQYHRREEWERAGQEINAPLPKGTPGYWVIHYPGSPASSATPMTDGEMVRYLQATQSSYLNSRGYSLGYSAVVSQSSSAWEVRGIEGLGGTVYNPASNPGRKLGEGNQNHVTRSIQIAVSGQDKATPAAVATVNEIIATQPDWPVRWHGQIDWTSCAGEGIIAQIEAGVIGHQKEPVEDDDMRIIEQYRAADTRVWPGSKLEPQKVYRFNAGEGIPKSARAMMATLTVTEPDGHGYVATAAPGADMPTSSLNYAAGQTIANTTLVPLVNGQYDLKSIAATHLVVDVLAYV